MTDERWTPHVDGFIKGHVGIFPGYFGSWEVWDNFAGEWNRSEPFTAAAQRGRDFEKDCDPPYREWERTREETIEEAKRLAESWLHQNQSGTETLHQSKTDDHASD
ncbi:hypothetical protein C8D77_111176 [Mesorhizobium loti]|uniref:Uncharacterized protein n=1 Tax=Rhizobium loti TaxID=381 RepID=A0A8E2WAQ4_RHILI|nr:hypothetical protein [Mesorhizobium loti]PWJ88453.1 hypothetical protein C8D77_111176 [Mesorhizobium loti]